MFHEVVRWMLQRDLLVSLHLRVRIVVPASVKARVRHRREELRKNRWHTDVDEAFQTGRRRARADSEGSDVDFGLFDDEPPWYTRRGPGSQHSGASIREVIEPPILEEGLELDEEIDDEEAQSVEEADAASRREEDEDEEEEGDNETSILADPGRATAVQRRWLQAMSDGKDELVTRRFDQFVTHRLIIENIDRAVHRINQYFDGKCTDDEILFRAEISRRQLREVLHVYDEYVSVRLLKLSLVIANLGL
jgi:hypothetical protein